MESLGSPGSCLTDFGALWISGRSGVLMPPAAPPTPPVLPLNPNEKAPMMDESRSLEYMLSRSPKLSFVMVLNRGMRNSTGCCGAVSPVPGVVLRQGRMTE